ncbi:MAG: GNAT family N-acetyltransferase [Erysipelotrichaceae bacterium]|nr:GNAT family N-acetyltransferase [Erysipelotrichaceae bacterium]
MENNFIRPITKEHLTRYGEIYANAFSGEPWNDPWDPDDAQIHVSELLDSKQSYGLEYVVEGEVIGFLLGTSMLFHYGRVFEINDLAVDPQYQGKGIGSELLEHCLCDMEELGMCSVNLITAADGILPSFYEKHGFEREKQVILMGNSLQDRKKRIKLKSMTEYEKMISGYKYDSFDRELRQMRTRTHELCEQYNSLEANDPKREEILSLILPHADHPVFKGRIQFNFGTTVHIGKNFYAESGFNAEDDGGLFIGDNVSIGSAFYAFSGCIPDHCINRLAFFDESGNIKKYENAKAITIGDGCQIGDQVSLGPGVTIGKNCIIEKGSNVIKDIPDNSYAAGTPCRVIKKIG